MLENVKHIYPINPEVQAVQFVLKESDEINENKDRTKDLSWERLMKHQPDSDINWLTIWTF